MVSVKPGDRVIGALAECAAALEGVGSWRDIGEDEFCAFLDEQLGYSGNEITPAPKR